jgi:hypothetical protein
MTPDSSFVMSLLVNSESPSAKFGFMNKRLVSLGV